MLFAAWWDEIRNDMFEIQWDQENPVTTPAGIKDRKTAVKYWLKLPKDVKEKYGSLDIAWGEVNRFQDRRI